MITVMQGILNVKLKSRAKAENVVRISEESLRNTEHDGCLCKKIRNDRNKIYPTRSLDSPQPVHTIGWSDQTRTRCRGLHEGSRRPAGNQARASGDAAE